MRYRLIVLLMLLCFTTSTPAQVSVGIGFPGVSIGINLPLFPELVPVPGYPVYYARGLDSNYFFYDGMYWVYVGDNWYASSWYNGPWALVEPEFVPLFVLRIPVGYYRRPPAFFRGWRRDVPPHWGEHWGRNWEQRRSGWDRWDRRSAPAPAPLPTYQRQYTGDRYPRIEQQHALHSQNYNYRPKDPVVRERFQQQQTQGASAPSERGRQAEPRQSIPGQEAAPRPQPLPPPQQPGPRQEPALRAPPSPQQASPRQEAVPRSQPSPPPQQASPRQEAVPRAQPSIQPQETSPRQGVSPRPEPSPQPQQGERRVPRSEPAQGQERGSQGMGAPREPDRGQGQGRESDREKGDERRRERER